MAARIGRQVVLDFGTDTLIGIREIGLELNGEPIDITSEEDNGVRKLLSNTTAEDQVSIGISGVVKDNVLRDHWFANTRTQDCDLTYPDATVISGSFMLVSYSEGEPYKDASTFEATLESAGAVTTT